MNIVHIILFGFVTIWFFVLTFGSEGEFSPQQAKTIKSMRKKKAKLKWQKKFRPDEFIQAALYPFLHSFSCRFKNELAPTGIGYLEATKNLQIQLNKKFLENQNLITNLCQELEDSHFIYTVDYNNYLIQIDPLASVKNMPF